MKASDLPPETTDELLARMEETDRRFRVFQTIFGVFIGAVLVGVGVGVYYQIQKYNDEVAARDRATTKIIKAEREENSKQTRYIQCIAQFFNTTDRAARVLTNIDKCNIQKNGQTVPGVDLTPTASRSSTNSGNPLPTGTLQGGGAPNSGGSAPVDNSGGGSTIQPAASGPATLTTPLPAPANSIPLCVMVAGVCIR